jgi:hypothetical protein
MSLLLRLRNAVEPPVEPVLPVASRGAPSFSGKRFRYSAHIDGKTVFFDDLEQLKALLDSYVKVKKPKIKKRVAKRVQVTSYYIDLPVELPSWATEQVQRANASLEAYYWAAIAKLETSDEEEAIILLI